MPLEVFGMELRLLRMMRQIFNRYWNMESEVMSERVQSLKAMWSALNSVASREGVVVNEVVEDVSSSGNRREAFSKWMAQVSGIIESDLGLGLDSFVGIQWPRFFSRGVLPGDAVEEALGAGEDTGNDDGFDGVDLHASLRKRRQWSGGETGDLRGVRIPVSVQERSELAGSLTEVLGILERGVKEEEEQFSRDVASSGNRGIRNPSVGDLLHDVISAVKNDPDVPLGSKVSESSSPRDGSLSSKPWTEESEAESIARLSIGMGSGGSRVVNPAVLPSRDVADGCVGGEVMDAEVVGGGIEEAALKRQLERQRGKLKNKMERFW